MSLQACKKVMDSVLSVRDRESISSYQQFLIPIQSPTHITWEVSLALNFPTGYTEDIIYLCLSTKTFNIKNIIDLSCFHMIWLLYTSQ